MKDASRPKVLIFSIAYYPFIGGAEVAVKEITDRIKTIEWHMITCALDKTLPAEEQIGNVRVHRIISPKYFFPFKAFFAALRLHRQEHFRLIWSVMAAYAGFAALFFNIIQPRVPFLLTLQEGDPISYIKRRVWYVYPLFRMIFTRADMIQAISCFLADFGREMGHKKNIVVVPNGVDTHIFAKPVLKRDQEMVRAALSAKPDEIFLVTTSRLVKKNAVDDIIAALAYVPQHVSLLVIGKGEEGQALQAQAERLGVAHRVKFLGFIPYEEIPKYFAVSRMFIRPSRSEGFGNSFIEAMAAGLPVIATPVGGIVDFIDDHATGVFCSPDNPHSAALAIRLLLDDPDLASRIASAGRERAKERYGWEKIARDMRKNVFEKLLG